MYAENLSFALILFAILRAISIGTKLLAPERQQLCNPQLGMNKIGLALIFYEGSVTVHYVSPYSLQK
jgi:hypothetical protein